MLSPLLPAAVSSIVVNIVVYLRKIISKIREKEKEKEYIPSVSSLQLCTYAFRVEADSPN